MGFWSAVEKVGKVELYAVTHPVETTKKVVSGICSGVEYVIDNVSGNKAERISEEARRIYNEKRKEYDEAVKQYTGEMDSLNRARTEVLDSINKKKEYIVDVLLEKMQGILSKIKYKKRFAMEHLSGGQVIISPIELRSDVLKIDFKKNPIKSRLKAFCTLGMWANSQASESLDEAKNEVKKLEYAMSRMTAELQRYSLMKTALEQTDKMLADMIDVYENVLCKAENVAKVLRFKCMQFTHALDEKYCKLESLPDADQHLMYALFNLSKILNDVAKLHLTDSSEDVDIKKYEKLNDNFKAAAA
ncbi:MAG: hypothetical protein Q4D21_00315 [Phascolarctobacterium sp.]|nr:hypothetical protein [Phascolarctobacterium sp.]